MPRTFISYARADARTVQKLVTTLRLLGHDVWIDRESMPGGKKWWADILRSIRLQDVFLFVISTRSLKSEACQKELMYAETLGKSILPVVIGRRFRLKQVPKVILSRQSIDFRIDDTSCVVALVNAFNSLPAPSSEPEMLADEPLPPKATDSGLALPTFLQRVICDIEEIFGTAVYMYIFIGVHVSLLVLGFDAITAFVIAMLSFVFLKSARNYILDY